MAQTQLRPWRRVGWTIIAIVSVASPLVIAPKAVAAGCANEVLRVEQSATALPECRAYELVSPPGGTPYVEEPRGRAKAVRASIVGGGIAWFSYNPLPNSPGGGFYALSTRGPGGWSTASVSPKLSTNGGESFECAPSMFFSSDLAMGVLADGFHSDGPEQNPENGYCASNEPPLVESEPEGFRNVFLRDTRTGAYQLVNLTPGGVVPADATFEAASEDFSHIVFEEHAKLTGEAPVGAGLYDWTRGSAHLVTVLTDGTPSTGSLPEAISELNPRGAAPYTHSVSVDGTRVVFEAEGKLYLRENAEQRQAAVGPGGACLESAKACTIQLDASQAAGPGGGGVFLAANAADTEIFFSDAAEAKLTSDTAEGTGQHVYEYDTRTGKLRNLTAAGEAGLLGFSGISEDGSHLYLVAEGVLASGATAGQPNLYLFHAGTVRFIATLSGQDRFDWMPSFLTARVSPDGRYIGFNSIQSLTGYDNIDAATGEPDNEVYLYDASLDTVSCVSCGPSGTQPRGPASIQSAESTGSTGAPNYLQRNVLADGRVFFDTATPLADGATNGRVNVYEYAAGRLSLISTGSSDANARFYDASPTGEDVFLVTTQHLVRNDAANGMRLYDARVGGGFSEPASPISCSGEGCRGPIPGAPVFSTPATTQIQGPGNVADPTNAPVRARTLTSMQKRERALRACRRYKNRSTRAACIRRVRSRHRVRLSGTKHHHKGSK